MVLSLETLNYLQSEQKKLDTFIHQQNDLVMEDTFYLRKIALLVEIGEFANELRTFKYWKKDKEVNLAKVHEELIDCLHFFLSLTNCSKIDFNEYFSPQIGKKLNTNRLLLVLFKETVRIGWAKEEKKANEKFHYRYHYYRWLSVFERLCWQIDLEEKKLLEVYEHKNKVNHQRQLSEDY